MPKGKRGFQKGNSLGNGKPAYNFTEAQLRYAMANTRCNADAARFLNVHAETYQKYAKMYVDTETGKTLWELHRRPGRGALAGRGTPTHRGVQLDEILEGKHPDYPKSRLRARLLRGGYLPERCDLCGFCERRITDNTVPLLLDCIDGDDTNFLKDNLRLLCYNCFYMTVGNVTGRRAKIKNEDFKGY
jgi:hypothetical protein